MNASLSRLDSQEFAPIAALLEAWSSAEEADKAPEPLSVIARRLGVNERLLARRFAHWAGVSAADFRAQLAGRALNSLALKGLGVLASKLVQVQEQNTPLGTCTRKRIRTPFGTAELALDAEQRLCGLKYLDGRMATVAVSRSAIGANEWADDWAERLFAPGGDSPIGLCLVGTPFQREVWRALLALDTQECIDYGTLAKAIGRRNSQRAVGTAVGANPVGWLIPCHHVLRADGSLGGFRWGSARKRAMLVWESMMPTPSRAIPG